MARAKSEEAALATILFILEPTGALKGKKVCATGHLGLTRDEIAKIVESAGGTMEDDVRWGLNILVTNADWTAKTVSPKGSRKFLKAKEIGAKIMSEKEFYQMLIDHVERERQKELAGVSS